MPAGFLSQRDKENALCHERRRSRRHRCAIRGVCRPIGANRDLDWTATIYNLSTQGLGILCRHRFEPGTVLTVELYCSAMNLSYQLLLARVARTRRAIASLDWFAGCQLVTELSEADLQRLLGEASA